jgi:biopolymer transport protein ExbD
MGHDQRESSAAGVLVIIVALVVACFTGLVVVCGMFFWVAAGVNHDEVSVVQTAMSVNVTEPAMLVETRPMMDPSPVEPAVEPVSLRIYLDVEGKTYLNDAPTSTAQLKDQLTAAKDHAEVVVLLSAHPKCPFEHVVKVVDLCGDVGVTDVKVIGSAPATE